jgi:hypothetical protein
MLTTKSNKRKRIELTIVQKRELIEYNENNKITNVELIRHYNLLWGVELGQSTFFVILMIKVFHQLN